YEILTWKIAVHRTGHARGAGRSDAANPSLVLHATAKRPSELVAGRRQCERQPWCQQWKVGEWSQLFGWRSGPGVFLKRDGCLRFHSGFTFTGCVHQPDYHRTVAQGEPGDGQF